MNKCYYYPRNHLLSVIAILQIEHFVIHVAGAECVGVVVIVTAVAFDVAIHV